MYKSIIPDLRIITNMSKDGNKSPRGISDSLLDPIASNNEVDAIDGIRLCVVDFWL